MDIKRTLLYIGLAAIGTLLWSQWQHEHPSQLPKGNQPISKNVTANVAKDSKRFIPSSIKPTGQSSAIPKSKTHTTIADSQIITVSTDVMNVEINLKTGDLVSASLPQYAISLDQPKSPVTILSNTSGKKYELQSGVISSEQQPMPVTYTASQTHFSLQPGQEQLEVNLKSTAGDLVVNKTYRFKRGEYHASLETTVTNKGQQSWNGQWFQQITRQNVPSSTHHIRSYDGAAISTPKTPYKKVSYELMDKTPVNESITGGWIAMQQPYFVSAWVPPNTESYRYYSHVEEPQDGTANLYTIGYLSPDWKLSAGEKKTQLTQFYIGPEIAKDLAPVAPALKLTIDYGFLSPISSIIFMIMNHIHQVIGNWGWSIILVTLCIKLLFYWPSAQSYKSMAKMRKVQPRLQALKDRFGDDKAALSKATMEFYRKEKVNPMGGCLPMIIQIPVFFALYYVLIESVELRQAPFILWIHDLSIKDPYYVLPILMGLSMFLQQKISPAPPDPTQAKMMMLMPVVFTVVFLSFPAGLVLYWLTNNILSIGQQWYIMNTFNDKKKRKK
ncbi:MAG: membrane protein insertase YidC [Coxiellaceae bacterium]|nr:membrane protein insertase YidC [Coxiellaceae bacterium]